jgi:ketosteroid isomerase-like protein
MGELQFNFIHIEIIGNDQAFVLGQWKLKREKDEPQGYFTLRLKKIKGEWKVVYDHSS